MKNVYVIFFILIFSNLITYHITKLSTTDTVINNSKKRMIDAMFVIEDPTLNQTQERYKKETFRALGDYGWTVEESEGDYKLLYLENYQWVIPKKDE